ncbi:MAG TPA: DJ-1/PfpI family protein [Blastocatellia bacterium]|nr:DJ-1/PfpI family protein [Blastocatellia bacterium]
MEVAILIYDRFTALDAVGPYEVLRLIPGARVSFAAREKGPQRTDAGSLAIVADFEIEEIDAPDIVVIPGGPGQSALMDDTRVLDWVRKVHSTTRWTTSVCTGSLVLAAAGLLKGLRATSHWLALEVLRKYGAEPTTERVVTQGKIITAAGVSAGIDMALTLVALECGEDVAQSIQLGIEYDPKPPFNAGSPEKAPAAIVDALRSRSRFLFQNLEGKASKADSN